MDRCGWANNEYTIVMFQNSLCRAATKPHRRKDLSSHICFTLFQTNPWHYKCNLFIW